ncbi:Flp family type IVb pilin [Gimesia sp.]|uniref:Flp family type IVb pilin n=1 Tax=Gimesia sp. TaxID=2024833 RepID=UPI003A9341F1
MKMFQQFWNDENGFVVSTELVLIATVLVLGMIVGLTTLRDQVIAELADVAAAFSNSNQSYSFSGITGHSSSTSGSLFNDNTDFCDADEDGSGTFAHCITIVTAEPEGA